MAYLFEKIDSIRQTVPKEIKVCPQYIKDNLNPNFVLREYQINAFENFITFYESSTLRVQYPSQVLFHMATGSGKTLIMAGIMLYLYKQGYRNFLFFVNLTTIIEKTKDNFLNGSSSKYLFAQDINIDSENIKVNIVDNFQNSDPNAINICFTTIQGLHSTIANPKENSLSEEDFESQKIVFISDEAHHLNADTKKKLKKDDIESISWESTVTKLFEKNRDNLLLQFTATCGIQNTNIKNKYENKIVFDYPLSKFYNDRFSKEINTIKTDKNIEPIYRALLALILSQYRLKIFNENHLSIKPVVLFKSKTIKESKDFQKLFTSTIKNLNTYELEKAVELGKGNPTMQKAFSYLFDKQGLSLENLVEEFKLSFSEEYCISANDEKDAVPNQLILNSLEDKNNLYRVIFEVKKLDEGWDVLNLFDIVRLYSDRQPESRYGVSAFTLSEAQLIGRGARYCPFNTKEYPDKESRYIRKYDSDLDNDLKVCEELYYHCQDDSKYITELKQALKETGLGLEPKVVTYKLKDSFKNDPVYKKGKVFFNAKVRKSRNSVNSLPQNIFGLNSYSFSSSIGLQKLMTDDTGVSYKEKIKSILISIKEIADINYSIVNKAIRQFPNLRFNIIKRYFPNLSSTKQFIMDPKYLGNTNVAISMPETVNNELPYLYKACVRTFNKLSNYISNIEYEYEGAVEFKYKKLSEIFDDKSISLTEIKSDSVGESQSLSSEFSLDLSKEDWFVYNDNYGTSEEKAFVKYFYDMCLPKLREKFEKVFLIRNERTLAIYSFANGERFEPDYLLILQNKDSDDSIVQYQIFIEPKGSNLLLKDKWKEDFLLELHSKAILLANDANYNIWGFRFYNRNTTSFKDSYDEFCDNNM